MEKYNKGERVIYRPCRERCVVLHHYAKRDICLVRYDDNTEDVVNTADLERELG